MKEQIKHNLIKTIFLFLYIGILTIISYYLCTYLDIPKYMTYFVFCFSIYSGVMFFKNE